tara:strand:- start:22033 stop:22155 length:123 start_codon:yes stop_codon:yes gene_type:complete
MYQTTFFMASVVELPRGHHPFMLTTPASEKLCQPNLTRIE